jgi:hypothetical protein
MGGVCPCRPGTVQNGAAMVRRRETSTNIQNTGQQYSSNLEKCPQGKCRKAQICSNQVLRHIQ